MDDHFRTRAGFGKPADDGPDRLSGTAILGYPTRAVIPYDQRLARCLPICSNSTWNRTARA
jgi:hypothetical protein